MDLTMMERVGDRLEKMEGSCSTGQRPQRAVVPVEEEEEEEEELIPTCVFMCICELETSSVTYDVLDLSSFDNIWVLE
jgi:hypothetical protein